MSKFIKCWVFIICLLFIFLILFTDSVGATSVYNIWLENKVSNQTISNLELSSSNIQQDMTFNNVSWTQNYDFFNGSITIINNTQRINIINGDSNIQCNTEGSHHFYETSDTYYQDGSTSSTSTSSYNYYCSNFTSSNDNSYISNIENMPSVELYLYFDTYTWVQCPMDTNGNFTCPLVYNNEYRKTIQKLRIRLHKKTIVNTYIYLQLQNYAYITTDIAQETKTIIQQQITQQQSNSDREYNFISNSTIDSTTTSNVNNIDVSNSDTKLAVTNFALIPLNFMQSIINSFSSSCSQVCIGNCGSGHDNDWRFVFPCLDFESILGSNLYTIIDSLFAFGMVFAFIRSVRNFFINALLLTTDASSEVGVFL